MQQPDEEAVGTSPGMVADLASLDDPRAMARELREQPVQRIGDMFTLVTRREHVEDALRKSATFCWSQVPMDLGNVRPLIPLQIDPPQHVKYRRILDPLFAPKKMALLEDEVVGLVKEFVDKFAARGSCDFHEEFAVPLPCTVFLRLMGLPYSALDVFLAAKDDIIRPDGMTMEDQAPARAAAGQAVYSYFEAELERRHAAPPTDDLLAQIMAAEVDGVRLTDEEVLDVCYLFIIAGLDTVTDSLDCFFAYLAQEPEQRRLIATDESVIPSAVEELLRWESPVPAVPRVATEDVDFGGLPRQGGRAGHAAHRVGQHRRRSPPRGRHRRPHAQPQSPPCVRGRRAPLPGLAPCPPRAAGGVAGISPPHSRLLAGAGDGAAIHAGAALAHHAAARVRTGGLTSRMRIRLDADRCQGHGRCYTLAPELFDSDDVGHCVVIAAEVPPGLEDKARSGVENCPEQTLARGARLALRRRGSGVGVVRPAERPPRPHAVARP